MDKYESEHNKIMERYAELVKRMFGVALTEFVQAAYPVLDDYQGNEMFAFDDYPQTKAVVAEIVQSLAGKVNTSVVNGCKAVWAISEKKNDALVESLFKGKELTDEQKIRYFQNNGRALDAFLKRKENGMGLSDRVWNIADGYKNDIETALSVSIGEGKSAHDLAKEVQQYLREPDRLFRRVRDEFGELQLSKNAKNYHPGAGVYRSSYKNAMRLARTEINNAYRTADFTRYQQLDFIVGIEIHTSGNHPETDICDTLKGKYPKDFKFTGWHPQCRCYQTTILKTDEEMDRDEALMRKGKEPSDKSVNAVNDVPDNFKGWVEENEEKIETAKSKPYFVSDNKKRVEQCLHTPKTLRNLNKTIEQYENTPLYGKVARVHKVEIESAMQKIFNDNDYGMLIKPDSINSVIKTKFKNQFEIGESGGVLYSKNTEGKIAVKDEDGYPNYRLIRAHEMFGISEIDEKTIYAEQLKRNEYEKYGLLLNHNLKSENEYTKGRDPKKGYGTIEIRFKKEKVETTWLPEDSLGSNMQPSLTSSPKSSSWDNHYKLNEIFNNNKKFPDNYESLFSDGLVGSYLELQYHGDLTVDCIDSILFPYMPVSSTDKETISLAKQKGIKVYMRLYGKLTVL